MSWVCGRLKHSTFFFQNRSPPQLNNSLITVDDCKRSILLIHGITTVTLCIHFSVYQISNNLLIELTKCPLKVVVFSQF